MHHLTWAEILVELSHGLEVTAWITAASTVGGGILAFAGGIGKNSRFWPMRWIAGTYVEVFRGTSLLVQLFWIYFALPILIGLTISPTAAGILALSLNIGAYGAEVVRGSLNAVDPGQLEAAKVLNFKPLQTLWRVKLPQATVEMMPPFGNLAIQNLKDSSLVSLISLSDLAFHAENLRNRTLQTIPILTETLFLYFALALLLMLAMRWLERRVRLASGREGVR